MRALLLFALVTALTAQTPQFLNPQRKALLASSYPEIDKVFQKFFEEKQVPGMVYGLIIDGELVRTKSFGVRELGSKEPVTAETAFRIASMSKSFTALAILKLRDAGKLSLDDLVSKWIPETANWKYPTRDSAPLRVRQLLTHSAGFPEDNPWGDRQLAISDAEMTRWLEAGIPFSTPPDSGYEYSNYGFAMLGRIVAKASGKTYEEYLQKEILQPLGLQSTWVEPRLVPPQRRAFGYGKRNEKYFEIPSLAHGAFGPMGGLVTDVRDLAKYVAYQLSAEPPRDDMDNGPVKRSSMREMQRIWRANGSGGYGYGLGISSSCRFDKIVSHGGGLPGFGSYMMWLPEYGVGMVAMANLTYTSGAQAIREAFEVLAKTGGLEPRVLPASPVLLSTQSSLLGLWNRWSDAGMDAIAADNLFLDKPRGIYQSEMEELKGKFTNCSAGALKPENWLRGTFPLECKEGKVGVTFTLAPTNPPKLQALRFVPNPEVPAAKSCAP
ncbi:serine hydrolase domain-containing protein [Bryobacter aggregatus]|uniref:serine hydrolase domain-containing protein n=1 Tax=Bryobacter aggregatus TaxID=360054 RepID=UPI000690C3D3|nr:serine hydrolase domain-containing protein [Bryobacter aggregatus]